MSAAQPLRVIMLVLVFCFASRSSVSGQAHTERAATLIVVYEGVELRRANTEAWLPLEQRAQMPIGAGDQLRTNLTGRGRLIFEEQGEVLLLPNSSLQLLTYAGAPLELRLRLIQGYSVHQVPSAAPALRYEVETSHFVITQPADLFAVQKLRDSSSVVVAQGTAQVQAGAQAQQVVAGEGLRGDEQRQQSAALEGLPHFAQLEGQLDGCAGLVAAQSRDSLNVRAGPGEGYFAIGLVDNGETVQIVAQTPLGERYRVRYLSAFGWVIASGVITSCSDLPIVPYDAGERFVGVVQPEDRETALLQPFFGTLEDDPLFYGQYIQIPFVPEIEEESAETQTG